MNGNLKTLGEYRDLCLGTFGDGKAAEFFDKWRHLRRPIKPANERKIRTNAEIDAQEFIDVEAVAS